MYTTKKKLSFNKLSLDLGCSSNSSCKRPNLSSIFNPKPKSKTPLHNQSSPSSPRVKTVISSSPCDTTSSSSTCTTWTTSTSAYSDPNGNVIGGVGTKSLSVAVEKDSTDPYWDFKQSMLQMINENQIKSKDDLKELLHCFLQVNAPSLHGLIIRVFTEIWNAYFFSAGSWRPNHYST